MAYIYTLPMIFSAFGALLCLVRRTYFEEVVSVIVSLATIVAAVATIFLPNFSNTFLYVDGLSKIMLIVISIVYTSTVIFSTTYMKYMENPLFEKNFYYLLMNVFAFTMFFTVSVNSFGMMWIGVEATTVTSALLVATENNESAIEATWRYIVVVSSGLIISLLSNVFIYASIHTLSFSNIMSMHITHADRILLLGTMMAVIGYGTKAGIFPMHTWLPDVHGKAPAPVSAIFSGVLLPVALYVVARVLQAVPVGPLKEFSFVLGFLTVSIAASLMVVQKYYKRLFAYSTMENMGMVLIGLSLGKYAFIGAIVLITSHAFAKSSAFFLSGNILAKYKSRKIEDVKGIFKRMPFTGYTLMFSSMAVTGTPPFGTFVGEMMIIYGILKNFPLFYALALTSFLALAFISVNSKVGKMVFSESSEKVMERKRVGRSIPIINIALAFLMIFLIPQIEELLSKGMVK